METVYRPKKLMPTGALFSVFLIMLIIASFVSQAQVAVNIVGNGNLTIQGTYTTNINGPTVTATSVPWPVPGEILVLTATPDAGWAFDSWAGDPSLAQASTQTWTNCSPATCTITLTFIKVLTITPFTQSTTYGTDPNLSGACAAMGTTFTVTGWGPSEANPNIAITLTSPGASMASVGSYDIVPSAATPTCGVFTYTDDLGINSFSTYTYTYVTATNGLTVDRYPVAVTASNQSKVYGNLDPSLTWTSSPAQGFVLSNTLTVTIVGNLARTANENVGTYSITQGTVTSANNPNYTITSFTGAVLTITTLPVTVTATTQTKIYGNLDPALTYTSAPAVGSALPNGATITYSGTLTRTAGENIGSYTISQGTLTNTNYAIAFSGANFSITTLSVTVTADVKSKTYGDLDPALTFTSNPAVGSALPNGATITYAGTLTRTAGENVGTYTITQGTVSNTNYTITYNSALLTINRLPVTVTGDDKTKCYGEADPALTFSSNPAQGFALPNALTVTITGTLTRVAGEDANNYAINQGTVDNATNTNYDITFVAGVLTITQRPITITANNATKNRCQPDPLPWTYTYTPTAPCAGLAFSDSFTGALDRVPGSDPGVYSITQGTLSISPLATNYNITYVPGVLTITAASIDLTVNIIGIGATPNSLQVDVTKLGGTSTISGPVVGTTIPGFSYNEVAYLNAIAPAGWEFVEWQLAGSATSTADPDVYTVTCTNNVVTAVFKKTLTITADNKTKVYGTAGPALTYTVTGLMGTDALNPVPISCTGTPTTASVGAYTITVGPATFSSGNASDYVIHYVTGTLTVTALQITVTADAKSKIYGDVDPALTYTFAPSLIGSDAFTGALTRTTGENVGTYPILQGTLALSSNYTITYVGANLTIGVKTITVTAVAKSKVYGDPDPALTYTFTPALIGSDAFTGALTRTAGENVGTYPILQGTLALSSNYTITYVGANLTIGVKTITVTAAAKSKTYGASDPALTYTYAPALIGSDAFSGALTRTAGENVGSYSITQGTLTLSTNYVITYVGADLTINKLDITITAAAKTKVYGAADPALTYTSSINPLPFTDAFTGGLSRVAGEDVGTYTITIGSLTFTPTTTIGNYNVTYVPALLTITKANLTITVSPATRQQHAPNPPFSIASFAGLVNGDVAVNITGGTETYTTTTNFWSPIGIYPNDIALVPASLTGNHVGNYNITYVNGTMTITPADQYTLGLGIIGCGQKIIISVEGTALEYTFVGDRTMTPVITPTFNYNQRINIRYETVGSYSWYQWQGPDALLLVPVAGTTNQWTLDFTKNMNIEAFFRRDLNLSDLTLNADPRQYDGTVWANNPTAVINGSAIIPACGTNLTPRSAVSLTFNNSKLSTTPDCYPRYDTKDVGTGKTVTFYGLALTGTDAMYYRLIPTSGTTTENITQRQLLVKNAAVQTKVYDRSAAATIIPANPLLPFGLEGNTPPTVGVIAGDNVTLTVGSNGTFRTSCSWSGGTSNYNVGVNKPVNVSWTLGGTDAANYTLIGYWDGAAFSSCLYGTITPKPLTLPNLIAQKRYDGTTTMPMTLLNAQNTGGSLNGASTVPSGIISGDVVTLVQNSGGTTTANFIDAAVGATKTLTITNLGLTGANAGNYSIANPYDATGDIIRQVYAMFIPNYNVGRAGQPPIVNVPLNQTFKVKFSENIYNVYQVPLSQSTIGDHISFQEVSNGTWTPIAHIPFTATYDPVNYEVTINLVSPLTIDKYYRIRFFSLYDNIYYGANPISWSLDGPRPVNPAFINAAGLTVDDKILFGSRGQAPLLYPSGSATDICDAIKVDFVYPVEYRNGLPITPTSDCRHKLMLQKLVSGTWTTQTITSAVPTDFVTVGTKTGPRLITITSTAPITRCSQYRVLMLKGEDTEYGFTDLQTGVFLLNTGTIVTGPTIAPALEALDVNWTWTTTCLVPVTLAMNPASPVGGVDYPVTAGQPFNQITVNGVEMVTAGAMTGDPAILNTNPILNWGANPFVAIPAEGYKWVVGGTVTAYNWKRNNVGYAANASMSVIGADQATTCNATLPTFAATFVKKSYNLRACTPTGGTISGLTTSYSSKLHGEWINLTATPAPGYYFTGWSGIPGGVTITTQTLPEAGDPYNMNTAKIGYLTFRLTGNQLVDAANYTICATFAEFQPRLYVTENPQNTGEVITSVYQSAQQLIDVGSEVWTDGLLYGWSQMKYNALVQLEAVPDCGYEFVNWTRWNTGTQTWTVWSNSNPTNPTAWFNMTENYRFRANMRMKDNVVNATAQIAANGTVTMQQVIGGTPSGPMWVNGVPANPTFHYGDILEITVYPEPDYVMYGWSGYNTTAPVLWQTFADRTVYRYTVECDGANLLADIGLKRYQATISTAIDNAVSGTTITGPTISSSTPVKGAGQFGFVFAVNGQSTSNSSTNNVFERGTSVYFRANAIANFNFLGWRVGGIIVSTNTTYNWIATQNYAVQAVYEPIYPSYKMTVIANPQQSPYPSGKFQYKGTNFVTTFSPVDPATSLDVMVKRPNTTENITVSTYAQPGWEFVYWTIPANVTLRMGTTSTSTSIQFYMPASQVDLVAVYRKKAHSTITMENHTYLRNQLTAPYTQAPYTIVNYGGTFVTTTPGPYSGGQQITVVATPFPGFRFINSMDGSESDDANNIWRGWQVNPLITGPNPWIVPPANYTFTYTIPYTNTTPMIYGNFAEIALPNYPVYKLTSATNPALWQGQPVGVTTGDGNFVHGVEARIGQSVVRPGWQFNGWTGATVNTDGLGDYIYMNSGSFTVTANYIPVNYTLLVSAIDPYGIQTVAKPGSATQTSAAPISEPYNVTNDPIWISTTPQTSPEYTFVFHGWYYDNLFTMPVLDNLGNPITAPSFYWIPQPGDPLTGMKTIYAKYTAVYKEYTVTLLTARNTYTELDPDAGTVTVNGVNPWGTFSYNTPVVIATTPNVNGAYVFKHWTDVNGVVHVTIPTFNHTVNANVTFIAVYDPLPFNVAATVQGGFATTPGTVNPVAQVKTFKDPVQVNATVNAGYTFDGWQTTGVTLVNPMANPASFSMPPNNVQLMAKYVAINYNVTATAQTGGTATPASQVKNVGQAVSVNATPLAGYTFSGWEATGVTLTNPNANPAVFTMPANNVTLLAKFTAIPYTFTVTANPVGSGTFSPVNPTYTVGQSVSVTAIPALGWTFDSWTVLAGGIAAPVGNPAVFLMPAANVQLRANFIVSNNTIAGQVKYFNQFETVMPSSANIKVAIDNGGVLEQEQFLQYVPGQPQGYYQFNNIVPGTNYNIRIWEAPAGGTVGNTWSWNNWGGVNSLDALIISYMFSQNPSLATQFPWLVKPGQAVPNWSEYFGGLMSAGYTHNYNVANVDQNGVIDNLDALLAMYRSIGQPGTSPFPGGAFNFQIAGQMVATLGTMVYPAAPTAVFNQTGTYLAAQPASSVYYTKSVTGAAGAQYFNIFYEATGDVNASYIPGSGAKSTGNYLAYESLMKVNVGDEVKIPVAINQDRTIGAMNIGLTYNTNLLKVTGVEGFEVFNIDEANGVVSASMFDVEGRTYDRNSNVIIVTATVLAPIETGTRYFELTDNTIFADASASEIDGITLYTTGLTTDQTTGTGDLTSARLTHKCFPNPFNDVTNIQYTLPEKANVEVKVYNAVGSVVKTFVFNSQVAGVHNVKLNSTDLNGSGVYFYRITVKGDANSFTGTGSLILVK